MKPPHIVVYTAISRGYDKLRPVPLPWRGEARFVAFLDEPQDVSGWEVLQLHREFKDSCRNAKIHKALPHRYFPEADYSLCVDGSVRFKSFLPIRQWPRTFLRRHDLAVFRHQFRHCLYVEGAWCLLKGLDQPTTIHRQMEKYFDEGYPRNHGLALCPVLFRRHGPATQRFNEVWWREIQAHSRRDQLSFNYAAHRQKLRFRYFPWFISRNPHFTWHRHVGERSKPS